MRILAGVVAFFLGVALFSTPASAQTLTVNPVCGVAGSSVTITGSGWAEPQPVCDYFFFFDGKALLDASGAPVVQPDGLFGRPNRTATIPADATPGEEHTICVEIRLSWVGRLL